MEKSKRTFRMCASQQGAFEAQLLVRFPSWSETCILFVFCPYYAWDTRINQARVPVPTQGSHHAYLSTFPQLEHRQISGIS